MSRILYSSQVTADSGIEYAPTNFTFSSAGTLIGEQPSYPQIQRFMDVTNLWMDGVDYVERYFWFGAMYEMVS